jgi:hypothetical protein
MISLSLGYRKMGIYPYVDEIRDFKMTASSVQSLSLPKEGEPQLAGPGPTKHVFEALLGQPPGVGAFLEFRLAFARQHDVTLAAVCALLQGDQAIALERPQRMAYGRALDHQGFGQLRQGRRFVRPVVKLGQDGKLG